MKKTLASFNLAILSFIILFSTSLGLKGENEDKVKDELTIIIGHLPESGTGIPDLSLTFEKSVSLIRKLNTHIESGLRYEYTVSWIEVLDNLDGSTDYYLASKADVKDFDGEIVYSCYTHFILLEAAESGDLIIASSGGGSGTSYTCIGHCCKTCVLKPAGEGQAKPSCECEVANTVGDCSGKTGYCVQTSSNN